jgi:hypothetical protein
MCGPLFLGHAWKTILSARERHELDTKNMTNTFSWYRTFASQICQNCIGTSLQMNRKISFGWQERATVHASSNANYHLQVRVA